MEILKLMPSDSEAKWRQHSSNTSHNSSGSGEKQKAEKVLSELRSIDTSLFENVTFEALAPGPPVGKALELTLSSIDFTELLSAVKGL